MLKFNKIEKWFNDLCVLKDFSMDINREEIVCIIGPSGCGKSTLLNICSGILEPSKGTIINNSSNISYVFQEDRLLPWKNVYDNIHIVNSSSSREQCMDLLKNVGLEGFEKHYPSQLSGGMRQRCSIARAFNFEADLLLMDEPLKSLDYTLRLNMIKYILNLWNNTKKNIIYVTHEIDEAILLGDKILVLSKRPSKVIKEFKINTPKGARKLNDAGLVEVRSQIIELLQMNMI
ncbi:ABC transporter ATP-binding protein [Vallitalea sp.]|jgi:NitT/TauT family transport system ATP-binding protein|uniref:ABC transporter ATP-binding protein n=1 Tax=Vallitalea sp. TaxID=1882829 RepID=UPI0025FFAA1B|nr:ABC transporter ATP-binding protein [Vallitalea sp.]MCT4686210.1 ABC transporter ATP-binding protein [Vallitalea sp.]